MRGLEPLKPARPDVRSDMVREQFLVPLQRLRRDIRRRPVGFPSSEEFADCGRARINVFALLRGGDQFSEFGLGGSF